MNSVHPHPHSNSGCSARSTARRLRRHGAACRHGMAPHRLAAALAAASLLTLSLWPGLESAVAQTLPNGLNVVQGQARVATAGSTMTVTNSPGAILNWNSFSIGTQSAVRFDQASASSQVLNRVVGNDPSSILGRLSSNGKVWLLNPNGVLFGQNARVDVAGLVTSTLNLADKDWSAGRYAFNRTGGVATGATNGSAEIVNQGELRSSLGGYVMLVGSRVRNEGLIEAPGGRIVLAAGRSVELIDTGSPNLSVKVTAPQGSALNLGTLAAAGGRIDIHAAVVNQQGLIRASSLDMGAGGEIVLRASQELTLGAESRTRADGGSGGNVTVDAGNGSNMIHGQVSAIGGTGLGGQVQLLGRQVGLAGPASVDVSGASGGGQVLVGGGQQGLDASVPNSEAVFFGPDASIAANATGSGAGGRIILWSDKSTRAYGSLSARGGPHAGNGGFIETSGHWLDARPTKIDTRAPHGVAGQWLIDPYDLLISDDFFSSEIGPRSTYNIQPGSYFTASGDSAQILTSDINTALQQGTLVTISTGAAAGTQAGNVTFRNAHIQQASSGGTSQLNVAASGQIVIDGSVLGISSATDTPSNGTRLNVNLQAGLSGEGAVSIINDSGVHTNGGRLDISGSTGTASAAVMIQSSVLDAGSGSLSVLGRHHGSVGAATGILINSARLTGRSVALEGSAIASSEGSTGVDLISSSLVSSGSMTVSGTGAGSGVRLTAGNSLVLAPPTFNPEASLSVRGTNTAASSGYGVYINLGGEGNAVTSHNGATVSITGETAGPPRGNTVGIYADGSAGATTQISSSGALDLRSGHDIQLVGFGLQTDSTLSLAAPGITVTHPTTTSAPSDSVLPVQSSAGRFTVAADFLSLGAGTRFESAAGGDPAMVLRGFSRSGMLAGANAAGRSVFSTPNGRWLFYTTDPLFATRVDLRDLNYGFKQYGVVVGDPVLGNGNGLMFSIPQVAALRADVVSRNYDGTSNASASNFRIQGVAGDVATGLSLGAPPAYLNADAGVAKPVTVGVFDVPGFQDVNGRPVYGYVLRNEVTGTVFPKPLQWSVRANDKVYDSTPRATGTLIAPPVGLVGSESVGVNIVGSFEDKKAGLRKPVVLNVQMVDGTNGGKASNYTAPQAYPAFFADITPAPLLVSGLIAVDKVYDATTAATLNGSAAVQALAGDIVGVAGTGVANFADKKVGNAKPVSVSGLTLTGLDAGNYLAVPPVLAASITPASLTVSGLAAASKVYDGSTLATLTGAAVVSPFGSDLVTAFVQAQAFFDTRIVGNNKPVTLSGGVGLSGADAQNYTAVAPVLAANITPAPLVLGGLVALNKVYDSTVAASLSGSLQFSAVEGDSVSVVSGSARFTDKNAGIGKPVSLDGYALRGGDASNYTLVLPTGLSADITPARLAASGLTVNNKVYDANTSATFSHGASLQAFAGDAVTVNAGEAQFVDKNVGVNKAVRVTGLVLAGADAGNYVLDPVGNLSANITPATLQYRANPANKASGDVMPPLDGTVTGFVGSETPVSATNGTLVFTSTADFQSPAGSYAVQGSGLAALNYTFEQAAGNASALTVTGPNPTATLNQSSALALTIALATPTVKINRATSGLIDFMQAPIASNPAVPPGATGLDSKPSFAGVRLSAMSQDELAGMLAARDQYKKALFADSIHKLERDPSLADLPLCKSRNDVEQGRCLLTDALKREIRRTSEAQAPQQSPQQSPVAQSAEPAISAAQAAMPSTPTTPATPPTLPTPPTPVTPAAAVVVKSELASVNVNLAQKRKIKSAALPQIERKVAVVIGVDEYADQRIPALANAVNDARSVASLFESALGYETVVLANATKLSVVSAMNKLALELGPRDSVIVYYAGHGELVEATGLGYWQLADSDAALPQTWLSNADISRMVAQIGASQVALISDSCYSGSLVSNDQIRATPGGLDPKTLLTQKSVVVMSSGGNEPVFDQGRDGHSPFAWNLMNQLKQVNNWQPGGNVFARVRFAVARELPQRPKYGSSSAAGHQAGGDYLFEQRQLEAAP